MKAEGDQGDDRGTVLEPVAHLRDAWSGHAGEPPAATRLEPRPVEPPVTARGGVVEQPYRPTIRPLVPRLTLLDDAAAADGETIRLRDGITLIGRTEGHVRLPHDPLVSGRHAEIVREGAGRPHRWLLRDLGSSNGTFVRCSKTVLRAESLLILGGRRFRFRPPPQPGAEVTGDRAGTMAVDLATWQAAGLPALVETGPAEGGLEIPLSGADLTLGRPGQGHAIEIDDPLLAPRHARIRREAAGHWVLEAVPSLNGVWAQITCVPLAAVCRFQVGEQRFLFVVDGG